MAGVTQLNPQPSSLDELFSRGIATSSDRPEWLRGRALGVTATELAKLAKSRGGAKSSYARKLIKEKLAGGDQVQDLEHVARIRFGRIREEYIAEWARRHFNAQPSAVLFRAADNERFLATPDAVGVNFDDELFVGEYKSTSLDLTPVRPNKVYWSTGYYDQKQWSMRVTGARRALFIPELHDDDWSGWPDRSPATPTEPEWFWVERDEGRIAALEKLAVEFLAELDAARDALVDEVDPHLDKLAYQVLEARAVESGAATAKKMAWDALLQRLAVRPGFTQEGGIARVTWSPPETSTVDEFDHEAAVAANPLLYAEYERITAVWAAHQQEFTKPSTVTKPGKLTVTPMKGNDDD